MFELLITFKMLLSLGFVEPMNEDNEGRDMYYIYMADGHVVDYAYKEEVLEWIETGSFEYNEALTMNDLAEGD